FWRSWSCAPRHPTLSPLLLSSAVRRGLHSFPTRRSSDLRISSVADPGALDVDQAGAELGVADADVPGEPPVGADGPLLLPAVGVDRKSTRLNSSHVKISYAVFCLKKKNNTVVHELNRLVH